MYLQKLNEKQKSAFLDLSIHLAMEDENFSQKEMDAICSLCEEMNISKRFSANLSFNDAIDYLVDDRDKEAQRIILIELLGIAFADDVFENCERDLIAKLASAFFISQDEVDAISSAILNLYETYKLLNNFIDR